MVLGGVLFRYNRFAYAAIQFCLGFRLQGALQKLAREHLPDQIVTRLRLQCVAAWLQGDTSSYSAAAAERCQSAKHITDSRVWLFL